MITKKKVLKTVLLPEYFPRIKNLLNFSFSNVAYLVAFVYNMVRLLPSNHPYLQSQNIGQYTILQVMRAAASNVEFNRKNIDQVIIFFTIIMAMVILFIQFFLLFFVFAIPKSYAQASPPDGMDKILNFFKTENPDNDLAFQILNMVFGLPDFFGKTNPYATSMHDGLLALFNFYSYGMLIVGSFIIIYLAATTIMETAQSGTPFGQRFNKTWVPVRIILFFALLLPTANGLGFNPAQYITLMSAKLGSGFATNGWNLYNEKINQGSNEGKTERGVIGTSPTTGMPIYGDVAATTNYTLTGRLDQNVAIPSKSDMLHIPKMMTVIRTCKYAYAAVVNDIDFPAEAWRDGIQMWAVYKDDDNQFQALRLLESTASLPSGGDGGSTGWELYDEISRSRDISLTFGVRDPERYSEYDGFVSPVCGVIEMRGTGGGENAGANIIRQYYYNLVLRLWRNAGGVVYQNQNGDIKTLNIAPYAEFWVKDALGMPKLSNGAGEPPPNSWKDQWEEFMKVQMGTGVVNDGIIYRAVQAEINSGNEENPEALALLGWAGAGIWYNTIAEKNGALVAAIRNTPTILLQPRIMETIKSAKRREDKNMDAENAYVYDISDNSVPIKLKDYERKINQALVRAHNYWNKNPETSATGNTFIDIINTILGTGGLFEICKNVDVHPLAQLSTVGKSMLDNSIRSFGMSAGFTLFSIAPVYRATSEAIASTFGIIASVGLLVGFILFYILPFMPFIYFFFSVAGWVKTIFEAMVAMPLWALAHLRIDGDGIVGEAAIKGYYLIFEIFIRPILIVFGLIASIVIFAAMVKVLNQIFYLLLANTAGGQLEEVGCFTDAGVLTPTERAEARVGSYRGPMDEFFFTVLYTIIVYMIGTSCFKLIDQIPNNILRWINADVSTFSDNAGDAAEGLMKYATLGGSQFGSQLGGAVSGLGTGGAKQGQQFVDGLMGSQ